MINLQDIFNSDTPFKTWISMWKQWTVVITVGWTTIVVIALACLSLIMMGISSPINLKNLYVTDMHTTFNKTQTIAGSPIIATTIFRVSRDKSLNGLWISQAVPFGFTANTIYVSVDNKVITNYILEVDELSSVIANSTVYRWVLETPPLFEENNPVMTTVEIKYEILSTTPQIAEFTFNCWVAYCPTGGDWVSQRAMFGYNLENDIGTLTFN